MTSTVNLFEPESPEDFEVLAIERLAFEAQLRIQEAMREGGVSQKELAKRLGCTPARVSQYLRDGGINITLKTLARIMHALNDECHVTKEKNSPKQKRPCIDSRPNKWTEMDVFEAASLKYSLPQNDNFPPQSYAYVL